jgi:hypothetical protein
LLVVEHGSDTLDGIFLQGAKLPDPGRSGKARVTPEVQDLLLTFLQDLLHRSLLRLVQLQGLG